MMIGARELQLVRETLDELQARGQAERAGALRTVLAAATSALLARRTGGPRDYVTAGQAADVLGVSRQTIKNWVLSGRLIGRRVGGQFLVGRDAVAAELDRLQVGATREVARSAEEVDAERAWQTFLLSGLPTDKVARLDVLHQAMEDAISLSEPERAEMAALERDIADAAGEVVEDWLR